LAVQFSTIARVINKMRNILTNRRFGLVGSMVAILATSLVLALIPQATARINAENCANPPTTPTLNHWPITYDDENTPLCHDFRAIDAAVYTPNGTPEFSQSETDWQNGLQLNVGQEGVALIYVHNGAANNLPGDQTMARNVKIETNTDEDTGSTHRLAVRMAGDNTNTVSESFTVKTPSDARLEVIPNSGFMYDYEGNLILDEQNLNLGNSTYTLGDLDACFEYSVFLTYRFKVVREHTDEDTTLSIDKQVRNLDSNSSFSSSTDAEEGDRVEYRVKVRNTGNDVAEDVTVTDNGTSGVSIDSDSIDIDGGDYQSGNFPGTIRLGDLEEDEEVIITYEGEVTEDDCKTLTNHAEAEADNASRVTDSASVKIEGCDNDEDRDLEIRKQVKNLDTNSSFQDQVDVRTGHDVRFRITVTNNGDADVNDVIMTDEIPNGFRFTDNVDVDGDYDSIDFDHDTLRVDLGSIDEGDSKTIEFTAEVTEDDQKTICNEASATGDDVSRVEDEACVRITTTTKPGNPNITQSKRAFNNTKNVDAVSTHADRGNLITFTLVTTNTGNATAEDYVIRDDLSGVLPLADLVSTNGGTLNGHILTYPSVDIGAGQTVTKTFTVRVKSSLTTTLSYQIKNTYGNTVIINIPGSIVYEAPKTGSAATSAAVFAGLLTAAAVAVRRGRDILGFIFA
jgi:uncharacterized repeat protein (TIGR01451 family)